MLLPYQQTNDKNLTILQNKWAPILNAVIQSPIVAGLQLDAVVLKAGTNVINHTLGRKLQGYIVVLKSADIAIHDLQLSNQTPALTLQLVCSAPGTVSLWLY